MKLRIHMTEPSVSALGFGRRFTVWLQGCHKRCPGCIAPDAQPLDGGSEIDAAALAWQIIFALRSGKCEGLTLSGGEPTLQSEALCQLIDCVRAKENVGVVLYSGYTREELLARPEAARLLARCDILIDGAYERERDDGLALRGSSNQRVIPLTERYREALLRYEGKQRPEQEIFLHGCETHYAGIPTHAAGKESVSE